MTLHHCDIHILLYIVGYFLNDIKPQLFFTITIYESIYLCKACKPIILVHYDGMVYLCRSLKKLLPYRYVDLLIYTPKSMIYYKVLIAAE